MRSKLQRLVCAAATAGALGVCSQAFAQLGTVYVNFGGQVVNHYPNPATNNPPTTFNAFSLAGLFGGGFNDGADLTNVENAIIANLNADYQNVGVTFTTTQPVAGNYATVVIGNPNGGDTTSLYGQTDNIDFRHKLATHVVGVSATAHSQSPPAAPAGGWTIGKIAQVIENTAAHELGHAMGLVHSDVVSTFADTAGNNAAKFAAVQGNEQMTKNPNSTNFYADLRFGRYSQMKLDVSAWGINVETEDANAVYRTGPQADPGRVGEAGDTIATGAALSFDGKNRVTVLGSLAAADTDVFTFSGTAGQLLDVEALSITIANARGGGFNTIDGFTIDILDDLGNVLTTVGPGSSNWNGGEFDGRTGIDTESRSLLFEYLLPGDMTDTYGIRLNGAGADPVGDYELFVAVVPEPATLGVMSIGLLALARRPGRQA